jgi:hypothetical protein
MQEMLFEVALCDQDITAAFSSQGKVFQMGLQFYTLELVMAGVLPISEITSKHFSYCLIINA